MASYGRNLEFRIPPAPEARGGRFVLTGTAGTTVALGAPVTYDSVTAASVDFPGSVNVKLATSNQAPVAGMSGILLYEHAPAAWAGFDPLQVTYSDFGYAPVGKLVQ